MEVGPASAGDSRAPGTTFLLALPLSLHRPVLQTPGAGTTGGRETEDTCPALSTPLLPPPPRAWLALPSPRRDVIPVPIPVAETHLETLFRGDEEHVEGLPTLKGNTVAALLLAPAAALLGVEDHRGLVQPGVEMQRSLSALLLAAQQVHVKPGEGKGVGSAQEEMSRAMKHPDQGQGPMN